MDIIFEESTPALPILYDALNAQAQLLIETAQVLYQYQKTGEPEILQEGLGDIIQRMIYEVVSMIQKIRSAIANLFMRLNSRAMSYEKIMKKYAPELRNADITPFSIEGYDFTVTDKSRPNITTVHGIYLKYNDLITRFSTLTSDKVREICEDITSERHLSATRANLLGVTGIAIPQSTIKQEAFKFYRNGKSETLEMTINKEIVQDIVNNYENVINERKMTMNENKEINVLLNDMERFFKVIVPKELKKTQDVSKLSYSGPMVDSNKQIDGTITNIADFQSYVNAKYKQTVELAHAVTAVYTERIAAIDSKMKQDEHIVRQALDKIGKDDVKLEGFEALDKCNSYPMAVNKNWAGVWEGCNILGGGYHV